MNMSKLYTQAVATAVLLVWFQPGQVLVAVVFLGSTLGYFQYTARVMNASPPFGVMAGPSWMLATGGNLGGGIFALLVPVQRDLPFWNNPFAGVLLLAGIFALLLCMLEAYDWGVRRESPMRSFVYGAAIQLFLLGEAAYLIF